MGMKRIVQIITQIDGGNLEYKDGLARALEMNQDLICLRLYFLSNKKFNYVSLIQYIFIWYKLCLLIITDKIKCTFYNLHSEIFK